MKPLALRRMGQGQKDLPIPRITKHLAREGPALFAYVYGSFWEYRMSLVENHSLNRLFGELDESLSKLVGFSRLSE
jgi:hypothetical protein